MPRQLQRLFHAIVPYLGIEPSSRPAAPIARARCRQLVTVACLEFSPTRCEAIRFLKIIHSVGDQQLCRHKVPLLIGVQRHLEKDGSPTFLVLRFITVASAMAPDTRTKANARSVFQPTLARLRMAGLFFCRGGELIGIGCIRRGFTMGGYEDGKNSTSR